MNIMQKLIGQTVVLNEQQYYEAIKELSLSIDLNKYKQMRADKTKYHSHNIPNNNHQNPTCINLGEPFNYGKDISIDNRSAFGNALKNLAELNSSRKESPQIAVFDCDLADSVKTNGFKSVSPGNFFEVGIQEHNTATIAGAMSIEGIITFFADFGVFGICETYNQHRLNDINNANLKLVCTHVGLDVGEDGKTHQCIDYIGLLQNLYGFKIIMPADPNQTDKATRYISSKNGNFFLGMGRSKLPAILDDSGNPYFGKNYEFTYGKIDTIRKGTDAVIMSYGTMLHRAVHASEILNKKGINVGVLNVSCPKDLDENAIAEAARSGHIITYEDHNVHTGLGSIVANKLMSQNIFTGLRKLGVTKYGNLGSTDALFKAAGIDVDSLVNAVEEEVSTILT